jgi:aspartate carbamoyltransferase catalytic subunit
MDATSAKKGESLADTVRVIGGYADLIVVRHPWEGAAKLAAEYSPVPVINAGDGGHEHPTQTLCDLYTLKKRHGTLKGLRVALCGDLETGRTVHSLAIALTRFEAEIFFVPGKGKNIPDYLLRRLQREYGARAERVRSGVLGLLFGKSPGDETDNVVNAIYMTPSKSNQLALIPDLDVLQQDTVPNRLLNFKQLAVYFTRLQKERGHGDSDDSAFPSLTRERLKQKQLSDISILHPLPRIEEIAPDVDDDPRSLYFQQAQYGIPIRMALISHILGLASGEGAPRVPYTRQIRGHRYEHASFRCRNEICVTRQEPAFAHRQFELIEGPEYVLRCLYCDHEHPSEVVGNNANKVYYPTETSSSWRQQTSLANLRFFDSGTDAEKAGFTPAKDARTPKEDTKTGSEWMDVVTR